MSEKEKEGSMKHYTHYVIAYALFLGCLFTAPHVYSFFDFHLADGYEHYEIERRDWERQNPGELAFISYDEWQRADSEHTQSFLQEFGEQCALSFDPWFEPMVHHNERGED